MGFSKGGNDTRRFVIKREDILKNADMIKAIAGSATIYAVLKGNGLGYGLESMARTLITAGITRFCVTESDDARLLIKTNLPIEEILVIRPLIDRAEIESIIEEPRITLSVGSYENAELINRIAFAHNVVVSAHIAIDTGLGRYGFPWNDLDALYRVYKTNSCIDYTGIFTHFAAPERSISVSRQYRRFQCVIQKIEANGIEPGVRHCASSAALLLHPEMKMDAVRIGGAFLGRSQGSKSHGLQFVGCCEAQIIAVHKLSIGQTVGYGSSFRARRNMRVAVVDLGTTHGLRLGYASGKHSFLSRVLEIGGAIKRAFLGHALFSGDINNHIVPVVGNVFTECVVLDVTDCDCHTGDIVRFSINPMFIQNMRRIWI